jgi:hypothetical protein
MDAQAVPQPTPFPWRRAVRIALAILALALLGTAIGVFVWLRSYSPVVFGNAYRAAPPYGHLVEPVAGSGGTEVFFVQARRDGRFHVEISLLNSGRMGIDVVGPAKVPFDQPPIFVPVAMRATGQAVGEPLGPHAYVGRVDASHPLHLAPGEQRYLDVTYRVGLRCKDGQPKGYWRAARVQAGGVGTGVGNELRVQIKYGRVFDHAEVVVLPFAYVLMCNGGTIPTSS